LISSASPKPIWWLCENEVSEGILIDYKRDLYEHTPDGKREFLKDVSSFANSAGGHIIIGNG
jgi:predicted HTH transcriptional regulator